MLNSKRFRCLLRLPRRGVDGAVCNDPTLQGMNRSADRQGDEAAGQPTAGRRRPNHHPSGSFSTCFPAKPTTSLGFILAAGWVLISARLSWGGWLLSSIGALNVLGYTLFLAFGAVLGFSVFRLRLEVLPATVKSSNPLAGLVGNFLQLQSAPSSRPLPRAPLRSTLGWVLSRLRRATRQIFSLSGVASCDPRGRGRRRARGRVPNFGI